jgi:hypothetical protein
VRSSAGLQYGLVNQQLKRQCVPHYTCCLVRWINIKL